MRRRGIPVETLMELRQRLDRFPPRSKERRILIEETALLYGVSKVTMYRALKPTFRESLCIIFEPYS